MKQLTLYPNDPWPLNFGVTQLMFANVEPIWQLVQFFQTGEGAVLSDNGTILKYKDIVYIGDLSTPFDVGQFYIKPLRQLLTQYLDDLQLRELYETDRTIRHIVQRVLFENDLQGEIDTEWHISELLKYLKLRVELPETHGFYGIIENIIDLSQRLSDDRLLVFVNASVYLRDEQIKALAYDAMLKQVSCLFIDRQTTVNFIGGKGLKQIFIDHDFVQFVSDDTKNE